MTTALTSMAILKVNFDRMGHDVLDHFVPFLADRIYHLRAEAISVPDLRKAIHDEYGISIPAGVLKTLTKRCARRQLLTVETGVLSPVVEKLEKYDLSETRAAVRRQHAALVRLGVAYASRQFSLQLDEKEFDDALASFIRENAAPLLAAVVEGAALVSLGNSESVEMRYVIGSFVSKLAEREPEGFEYLTAVVKGALLASVLYFPNSVSFSTRLDNLQVYADTTLLLRAVGASGPDWQLYAREVIALAVKLGARVYCFKHTLDEILGVLDASEAAVSSGGRFAYGETTEYMLSAGWGASDVLQLKNSFEGRLDELGVRVRETPEHDRPLTLDENRLETTLQDEVRYSRRPALLRDIDSLTAIYRLRGGHEFRDLERCRAVFVTHNAALARATRKYMRLEEWDRQTIPLCIPDYVLTTLLWLKEPLEAPSLPEHIILADCFAAMRPDDSLWRRYLNKIEDLRQGGTVTESEYVLLRQSMPVRSLIMYETREDPDAFTEGTVDRVLAKARENIACEAMADAAEERQRTTQLTAQLNLAQEEARRLKRERDAETQRNILHQKNLARRAARMITVSLQVVIGIVAFAGTLLAVPWPGYSTASLPVASLAIVAFLVLIAACLSLYGSLMGGNLKILGSYVENWIAERIMRWIASDSRDSTAGT
jgi:hypothetical protein